MTQSLTRMSRRVAYVLRHDPASAGITLDRQGWARVDDLVDGIPGLTRSMLEEIVSTDAKGRYTLDGERIRAAQGHSTDVDPVGVVQPPPAVLMHGTTWARVESIFSSGLQPGSRRDVHLSADLKTATTVGARRGTPVILLIDAAAAHAAGHEFRIADNGVWLTSHVPAEFIRHANDQ